MKKHFALPAGKVVSSLMHPEEPLREHPRHSTIREFTLEVNQLAELKKSEQKLKESNELLHSIIETTSNMLSVLKSVRNEDNEIIDFEYLLTNASSRSFFQQDLEGKRCLQVFPHLEESGYFDLYKKVVETGIPLDTEVLHHQGGVRSWFRLTGTRLHDGLLLSQKDITKTKLAELEIQRQAELLKTIIDTAFGGVALLKAIRDADNQIIDFKYDFANPVKAAHLAIPMEELIGNTLQSHFPAVKQSGMWERLLQVMETGKTIRNLEEWHRGGSTIFIDQQYVKVADGVLAWDKDITRVKKAEQAARDKAEQFRSLVENTPDVITRWNSQCQLIYANPIFAEKASRSLEAMLGRTALEIGQTTERGQPWMDKLGVVLQTGIAQEHVDVFPHPRGAGYYHSRLVPEFGPEGTVKSVLSISRDITDIKRLEAESIQLKLNQQKELLLAILEAQENERRRIAEGLHNGIAQLLYAVKLNLDQLGRQHADLTMPVDRQIYEKADQLLVEAINQTRRISHELMPITLEDLGLEAAIRDIGCKFTNQALDFKCWIFNLEHPIEMYLQLAIYRIAQELANNIAKHASATQASLMLREENGYIIMQGEDNGKGFNPRQIKSNGMGLKSIRDRVNLLSGTMEIDSNPGQGTLITIYLPLPEAAPGLNLDPDNSN